MRLLIVTEHFWPEAFRVNDLAVGLRDEGHHVDVVTAMPNYPEGRYFDGYRAWGPYREIWNGIRVARVPVVPRGAGQPWRLGLNYLSFALLAGVVLLFARRRWDAVIVYQPTPVTTILPALVLKRSTPVIVWIQDLWPETLASTGLVRSRLLLRLAGALSRWLYSACDRLLVQSRSYVGRLEARGVPADRIGYLPNWAEALYDGRGDQRATRREWDGAFAVMFAGNLGRVQGLETVIDAAALVAQLRADVRWVFVGDGVLRGWLEDEVRRRGLERCVHFVGRRPPDEMPSLYASASAMLVSLGCADILAMTVPSKLQSYLAASAPILGSLDGEGARVIVEAEAGFASPAGDADALARNVVRMSTLAESERAHMGHSGRAYYEAHFSRRACLSSLGSALERAAGKDDVKGNAP